MKDRIEIYVQRGNLGFHAGARYPGTGWSTHKDDEATAAWRTALWHWFPKRPNCVILYRESQAITLNKTGDGVYEAILELPDDQARDTEWRRGFTPLLPEPPPKKAKKPTRKPHKKKGKK